VDQDHVMSQQKPAHRWSQYPPERARDRQLRRDTAARLLADYLDRVSLAVRAMGFSVTDVQLGTGADLEARIILGAGTGEFAGAPAGAELAWAEDVGWSATHPLLDSPANPWRYLHLELVPSPDAVANFLGALIVDGEQVGMPYPAQFRHRSQPLQPVIDALTRHAVTQRPASTPVPRTPETPRAVLAGQLSGTAADRP
jgi:hypothetical protein